MLRWRLLSAALGIPLLLGATYLGGWPLALLLAAVGLAAARELDGLLPFGVPPAALVANALYPVAALAGPEALVAAGGMGLLAVLLGETWRATGRRGDGRSPGEDAARAAWGLLAALYPGFLLATLLLLDEAHGWRGTWYVLLVVWASDTAAYFAGHLAARAGLGAGRPFAAVSPGKTVAGTWAGLLAGLGAGAALILPLRPLCLACPPGAGLPTAGAALGLVAGLAGLTGDLFESLLKRAAGRKDAGRLIPGHGGVLDRFDSLAFAAPVLYWLLRLLELVVQVR